MLYKTGNRGEVKFEYFKDKNYAKHLGSIDLSTCDKICSVPVQSTISFIFNFCSKDGTVLHSFAASNNELMLLWMEYLANAIGLQPFQNTYSSRLLKESVSGIPLSLTGSLFIRRQLFSESNFMNSLNRSHGKGITNSKSQLPCSDISQSLPAPMINDEYSYFVPESHQQDKSQSHAYVNLHNKSVNSNNEGHPENYLKLWDDSADGSAKAQVKNAHRTLGILSHKVAPTQLNPYNLNKNIVKSLEPSNDNDKEYQDLINKPEDSEYVCSISAIPNHSLSSDSLVLPKKMNISICNQSSPETSVSATEEDDSKNQQVQSVIVPSSVACGNKTLYYAEVRAITGSQINDETRKTSGVLSPIRACDESLGALLHHRNACQDTCTEHTEYKQVDFQSTQALDTVKKTYFEDDTKSQALNGPCF